MTAARKSTEAPRAPTSPASTPPTEGQAPSTTAGRPERLQQATCTLTSRELQCLTLAASGLSAKRTAQRLGIAHRTVEDYLANCRSRLNTLTTAAAVFRGTQEGWLTSHLLDSMTCAEDQGRCAAATKGGAA